MVDDQNNQIIVVGAGIGGIAVAIRLRLLGFKVLVLEKNKTYGGKLSEYKWENYRWDKGPSLFTDPDEVDALFIEANRNPRDYYTYVKMNASCSYFFNDSTNITFQADHQTLFAEVESKFGKEDARHLKEYLIESKRTYDRIGEFFIANPKLKLSQLLKKELITRYPEFMTSKLRRSLHTYNKKELKNEKITQIFDRFGTYNGSNPYVMSGLYSMIPHLELNQGTFFPNDGMRSIIDALFKLAIELGVTFKFDQHITSIQKTKENNYHISSNDDVLAASKVICAIDHLPFYQKLLKNSVLYQKYKKQERSSSAIVFYWAVASKEIQLGLHNIFFTDNYKQEFERIFNSKTIGTENTIYIHVSSNVTQKDTPDNGQNWFVMVNTPAGVTPTAEQLIQIKAAIFKMIFDHFQVPLEQSIVHEKIWDANGIEADTGSYLGALYGASSNDRLASFKRHGNQQKQYPNLYFCGGTVHPGGGIPLVLKSAKIVATIISNEK